MLALTPIAGPSGKTVTVNGDSVAPGAAVEIRWNSAQGQPLASTSANATGAFSVTGTVPDATPGVYYIVATAGAAGQPAPQIARIAFEVTGSADNAAAQAAAPQAKAATGSSQLWNGFTATEANVASAGQTVPTGASGTGAAGFGLLAAGAIGLAGGAALTLKRRSKASA